MSSVAATLDGSTLFPRPTTMINQPIPPSSWRDHNKHLNILKKAESERYGVIAAIAYNIEHIIGFVKAAERAQSPLIIQFFPWAITFSDGLIVRTAADAASRARVPISIHLDHCQDPKLVKLAADMDAFDSIMVDMSHYDKDENLKRTRELVAYCNDRMIATEAEPGRIEGGEDGVADIGDLQSVFTTEEEVDQFINTGVDALAPSFGNVHGEYGPAGPRLDFTRFRALRERTNGRVRLALHGTNGFEPELLRKCIAEGVSKVNVNRLVLDNYNAHLKLQASQLTQTKLMEEGVQEVIDQTIEWMEICGSAVKAKIAG